MGHARGRMGRRSASARSSSYDAALLTFLTNSTAGIVTVSLQRNCLHHFLCNASNIANAMSLDERNVRNGKIRRIRTTRKLNAMKANRYGRLTRQDRLAIKRTRGNVIR